MITEVGFLGGAVFFVACLSLLWMVVDKMRLHTAAGFFALANGADVVTGILIGAHAEALFNAGVCGGCAYFWWVGGDGNGTRRRLRSLARRFTPVRRTAPAAAS